MGGAFFFEEPFAPRLKPRENIQVADSFYEVVEVRPMLAFEVKKTNIAAETDVNMRDEGLKGLEDELLNYRLSIKGPVQALIRVEGAGGPVFGGWGTEERLADERTPPSLLEFVQLADKVGWPFVKLRPIVAPAWCRLSAYGYVYVVRELPKAPAAYTTPSFVWRASAERR
jgi:hypothetical protein